MVSDCLIQHSLRDWRSPLSPQKQSPSILSVLVYTTNTYADLINVSFDLVNVSFDLVTAYADLKSA
ncbi:hypothetical protein H6G00_30835 [Leptolyngbya sp. FACHB-541]|uniref:hypothetical protein n=1 Tax=Leptolyngbya sp. FACHB-541 TaxID=2692810 RepID=UPI0016885C6E|nr:hypothetical protein [Leptolyngbya sp. FACHB-541]MBD2000942.1 hypothetical protein [Leptolyngbya sp. FACHB-541]